MNTIYKASKSLVHSYSVVLALEHPDVLTTCFCPGTIDTDALRSLDSFKAFQNPGTPKQGADTGVFLINSERKTLENGAFYANRTIQSRVTASF